MTDSYTYLTSETFTLVHARLLASKVATDLSRFRRFYGSPSVEEINKYEEELVALLKEDYVSNVTYGFKRNGLWVEALKYHALTGGVLVEDNDPGKIRPGVDIKGAYFTSYLVKNSRWWALSPSERANFESKMPFQRNGMPEPQLESGYWSEGLNYSAGGRGIVRSTIIR